MTAALFLAELQRRGVIFQAHGGRLRVDAPVGVVTASDRTALVQHKAELLAMVGGTIARVEPVEAGLLVAPLTGFLRVRRHAHACLTCSRHFRCTAPACAGQPTECTCCKLDRIEGRGRR